MRPVPRIEFQREGSEWKQRAESAGGAAFSDIIIDQSVDRWPRLMRTDAITQRKTVILDQNPQLQAITFAREEFVHWKGKRGEPLIGGLIYPTGYRAGVRYPLVIQTHGFSEDYFLPDGPFTTAFAAQELANRGIAILHLGRARFTIQRRALSIGDLRSFRKWKVQLTILTLEALSTERG